MRSAEKKTREHRRVIQREPISQAGLFRPEHGKGAADADGEGPTYQQ